MTKMATTHTQEILHTLFPDQRIGTFNSIDQILTDKRGNFRHVHQKFDANTNYWARKHDIAGNEGFEYFGYAMRLRVGDTTFLDEADIYIESADDEELWGDNILSQLNPETTLVLNRNLRDWLISQFTFFYKSDSYTYTPLIHKFFHKNRLYARLAKYNFETINVTTESLDKRVKEFYMGDKILPDYIEDELYELSLDPTHVSPRTKEYFQLRQVAEPFVDQLIKTLKITEEEQNLPFIPRLL